jgi:predicted MPP superfamily phosphohydrolase
MKHVLLTYYQQVIFFQKTENNKMRTICKKMAGIGICLLFATYLASCSLIEYHPYDLESDDQPTNWNQKNIDLLAKKDDNADTLRFIFMGDTQRCYDETQDFVNAVNKRNDIDFVIHGGDITDFGMSKEYTWIHRIMKNLKVPYVALIGNHDIVGHGNDVYKKIYGNLNFSFVYRKTRFICLNTNALEFDYSTPVPDFDFMMSFMKDSADVKRTIVVMHAPPYGDEFNNNSALMFNYVTEQYKNLKFCLHAHNHVQTVTDYFKNGILYYGCEDISKRTYMLFTLTGDTYSYSVVKF